MKARYFAVPDPLKPGALSLWRVRSNGPIDRSSSIEPWPASAKKTWGIVRRADVPADVLNDSGALNKWLDEVETNALQTVAATINADPEAAAQAFAKRAVRCFCCARPLTDAQSKAHGLGPDCRRRGIDAASSLAGTAHD